jgi:uncharacterized protein (DUF1800 family)
MSLSSDPWARFEPTPDNPWDLKKVAHLHRRAGFGATRAELLRDLAAGPDASVTQFFNPPPIPPDTADALDGLRQTARSSSKLDLLKVCWFNRMIHGPDPLREKLTLFWHGHFATSNIKVDSVALMDRQNETLRSHALGAFAPMLEAMIADPAMLIWLDGATTKKSKPNENLGREFLELFTLGTGHYSESDVRAAARAFTGWTFSERMGGFRTSPTVSFNPSEADTEPKTFLGMTGPWKAADIVRITLEQPAAATFLANKLYRFFISESGSPAPELLEQLAREVVRHQFQIAPIVALILRSNHFYSGAAIRQRVKSPVEWSAGLVRMLEIPKSALNPLALAATCEAQGQELFTPPNVKGWVGGSVWINSGTLLERTNWAADLVWGRAENGIAPFDPLAWAAQYKLSADSVPQAFLDLLLQDDLSPEGRRIVLAVPNDSATASLRKVLQRLANCPEFQLA